MGCTGPDGYGGHILNAKQRGTEKSPPPPSPASTGPGSLQNRILVAMTLLTLVPLLIMAYQGYHCARQSVIEAAYAHIDAVARTRTLRIHDWLEERRQDLAVLRDLLHVSAKPPHSPQNRRLLLAYHKNRPLYRSIVFLAATPDVQSRGPRASHPVSTAFLDRLDTSQAVCFSPSHFHEGNQLTLHIGLRVMAEKGQTTGYLIAVTDLDAPLRRILRDTPGLGRSGKAYLLDAGGHCLVPPTDGEAFPGAAPDQRHALRQYPQATEYIDHRGHPVIGSAAPIQELDWTVVCEIDRAEGFGWLRALQWRALITGAAVLLASVCIALWAAKRLARPFRALSAVARRVGEGQHQERLHNMATAEAQEVASAFNRMLDRLEAEHRRAVQAASLAAIGELSSSIVHEMRNPLASIKLNLNALHERVRDDPDYGELCEIAAHQAARLERMFSDLLAYGKPLQIAPSVVSIPELVDEATESCKAQAAKQDVTLATGPSGALEVRADRELLLRALINLLQNAIHVSPPGGTVATRASRAGQNSVEIAIADCGPGVPAPLRERLFEPFYTTREGGTGLGLANVKKIVDCHGGAVGIRNRPEGGAIFTVRLPEAVS